MADVDHFAAGGIGRAAGGKALGGNQSVKGGAFGGGAHFDGNVDAVVGEEDGVSFGDFGGVGGADDDVIEVGAADVFQDAGLEGAAATGAGVVSGGVGGGVLRRREVVGRDVGVIVDWGVAGIADEG